MTCKANEATHYPALYPAQRLRRQLMLLAMLSCLVLATFFTMQTALAEQVAEVTTHKMILSHHEFEAWDFTPKPGDRIEITNKSDIAHSIYITYPDGKVLTLGDVQLPGHSAVWEVPSAGEFLFKCWIHPIINAKMKVQADTP